MIGAAFGLASALIWGAGDFSGGLASRRSPVYSVVLVSEILGLFLLTGLALLLAEPIPPPMDLLWSGAAGIAGTLGLLAFYRALAGGRMGVVAPVTGVVSAIVPVVFGANLEGMPAPQQVLGFGLAVVAVWLVSRGGDGAGMRGRDLSFSVLAGVGFGVFFVVIDHAIDSGILWPLVASRTASVAMLLIAVAAMGRRAEMAPRQLPLAALAGLLDAGGNAFYALAAQLGRLDVAAVLSSLYPATTVLLARFVLKEPISRRQWLGVSVALVAVVLIAS